MGVRKGERERACVREKERERERERTRERENERERERERTIDKREERREKRGDRDRQLCCTYVHQDFRVVKKILANSVSHFAKKM